MSDVANAGKATRHLAGRVARGVVDHNDLEVAIGLVASALNRLCEVMRVVPTRDDHRHEIGALRVCFVSKFHGVVHVGHHRSPSVCMMLAPPTTSSSRIAQARSVEKTDTEKHLVLIVSFPRLSSMVNL